jgi:hypothetical protein
MHAHGEFVFQASAEYPHGDNSKNGGDSILVNCLVSNTSSKGIRIVLPTDPAGAGCWSIKLTGRDGKIYRIGAAPPPPPGGPLVKLPTIQSLVIPPRKSNSIKFYLDNPIWKIGRIPAGKYNLEINYNPDSEFLKFYEDLGILKPGSLDLNLRSENIEVQWAGS